MSEVKADVVSRLSGVMERLGNLTAESSKIAVRVENTFADVLRSPQIDSNDEAVKSIDKDDNSKLIKALGNYCDELEDSFGRIEHIMNRSDV